MAFDSNKTVLSPGDLFVLTAHVRDRAGIDRVGFYSMVGETQIDQCGKEMQLASGTRFAGVWTKRCTVPSAAKCVHYMAHLVAYDVLGTYTNLTRSDPSGGTGFYYDVVTPV